jgi:glycerol-3-phosphate dehydrogenase
MSGAPEVPVKSVPSISALQREGALRELAAREFDLAIVGGGIAGAGVAREAARRGLSVALLEAEDFAAGTSSRSTKLVHGGLRYLAQGELGLVRESALERKALHGLAPHLAEPRQMVLPARRWTGALAYAAAVALYERLGGVAPQDRHRLWSRADLECEEPLLDRARWRWACAYREYLTDDARLVLANLRDAVAAGAIALNHARVTGVSVEAGVARGVRVRCALSDAELSVRARCVVNAAGPWVDRLRALEHAGTPPRLRLSKGVHVALPAARVPLRQMLYIRAADGRLVFAIRRGRCVYVGTTDTAYAPGPEHWPPIERAEVDYLLEPLGRYLAVAPPDATAVEAAWAGLRPLVAAAGRTSELSRRDEIWRGPAGVISLAGGKLTGYRQTALRVLEEVGRALGGPLPEAPQETSLCGGDFTGGVAALERVLIDRCELTSRTAARLARLYGAEALDVVKLGPQELAPGAGVLEGEVDWAVRLEGAAHLEDALYRRTRAALYDADVCAALVEPMARRMAGLLGWPAARTDAEICAVRARRAQELAFR